MHSLFFRIFILFWVAMALILGGSIALTVAVASRESDSGDAERRPERAVRASQVLSDGGIVELRKWLAANKDSIAQRDFFIVTPDGNDILGRRLAEPARRHFEFIRHGMESGLPPPPPRGGPGAQRPRQGPPPNLWPGHAAPQIVGPDGTVYTILFPPRRPGLFGALALPGIPIAVLTLALTVSALASGWLARHFSAPIRKIQEGARSVASEQLDVRVSAGLDDRKDELAVLARDFDEMADKLRTTRKARTQLLRDISHELRSPLARMRMAVGLARQSASDPSRQLDRMEMEIERLDSLISQILKLARLQGSDLKLSREPVELGEIIEEVAADARFEGTQKNCAVRILGAPRATVLGHPELLRSAIENVLRNAVRYSPDGAAVEIETAHENSSVVISIRDQGSGVPENDLKRIFEPFYRVAESRDRDSGGEGIGLAITDQVMRAHAGAARARNLGGGGLEVVLTLPLYEPRSAA
jgi:two-component system, OmpR family, sensor kinase